MKAYNDWMIEEWSGSAPGRFIPMIIIPLWDPALAAAEVERTAALGAKAIAFSENPYALGLPSIHSRDRYWDPLWTAAQDTGMPICTHVGSSSKLPTTSPDAPFIVTMILAPFNAGITCADWLFSGLFVRFPTLKLCLSEGGIGWMPYVLERCEYSLERQGAWLSTMEMSLNFDEAGTNLEVTPADRAINYSESPTKLFRDHSMDALSMTNTGLGLSTSSASTM